MGLYLFGAVIFIIICSTNIIYASSLHKKEPSIGFQGVRGKRSITDEHIYEDKHLNNNDESKSLENTENSLKSLLLNATPTMGNDADSNSLITESKSVPENSPGQINRYTDGEPRYISDLPNLSIVKRAPSGFMGMRGKKDSEYTEQEKRSLLGFQGVRGKKLLLNYPIRYIPKRAPSGFMGMRGKKYYEDSIKRAPSGFMGMRGKKNNFEDYTTDDEQNMDDEYDSTFFDNLQNERNLLREFPKIYNFEDENDNNDFYDDNELANDKRAPSGFMGMRGKKYGLIKTINDLEEIEKRAPSGFQGMRGKKSINDADFFEDKRAPMGFQGMRGKKFDFIPEDANEFLEENTSDKRTPATGFLGMRGKKQKLGSGFFGMRGKKPYDIYRKFVGVRGKKMIPRQFMTDINEIESNGLMSGSLFGSEYDEINKRQGPSGFQGMRGKK